MRAGDRTSASSATSNFSSSAGAKRKPNIALGAVSHPHERPRAGAQQHDQVVDAARARGICCGGAGSDDDRCCDDAAFGAASRRPTVCGMGEQALNRNTDRRSWNTLSVCPTPPMRAVRRGARWCHDDTGNDVRHTAGDAAAASRRVEGLACVAPRTGAATRK